MGQHLLGKVEMAIMSNKRWHFGTRSPTCLCHAFPLCLLSYFFFPTVLFPGPPSCLPHLPLALLPLSTAPLTSPSSRPRPLLEWCLWVWKRPPSLHHASFLNHLVSAFAVLVYTLCLHFHITPFPVYPLQFHLSSTSFHLLRTWFQASSHSLSQLPPSGSFSRLTRRAPQSRRGLSRGSLSQGERQGISGTSIFLQLSCILQVGFGRLHTG